MPSDAQFDRLVINPSPRVETIQIRLLGPDQETPPGWRDRFWIVAPGEFDYGQRFAIRATEHALGVVG